MELKKLEQFTDIVKEIEILKNRIIEIQQEDAEYASDTVMASSSSFPYTRHSVRITGIHIKRIDRLNRIKKNLISRKDALYKEMEEIEKFIGEIKDSKVRQIIELRYIKGLAWNTVAKKVYGYPNGDTARKKIIRFFKEI